MRRAILNLGTSLDKQYIFKGRGYGATGVYEGELVFTTNNPGYFKSITDPSFAGQILIFNYPIIGNYGASKDWAESDKPALKALVVRDFSTDFYHREADSDLDEYLRSEGVGVISGVDTRQLVRLVRDHGTINCRLTVFDESKENSVLSSTIDQDASVDMSSVMMETTRKDIEVSNPSGSTSIGVLDCGMKMNIKNELLRRGVKVTIFPADTASGVIIEHELDGLIVTNGPGDPEDAKYVSDTVSELLDAGLPIFGICMGNQLLSLASGAKTYKMKFGNRGANQPVKDLLTGKCYMTSQNHGYAIDEDTLGAEWEVWMRNLNDDSVEGFRHKTKPFRSVQFHPESSPGPRDTSFLFDEFINSLK